MSIPQLKTTLSLALMVFFFTQLTAQDPFFIHFNSSPSHYNPAMVGYSGAFSFNAKYKSQWGGEEVAPFRTLHLSLEESMPCNRFDLGLVLNSDQEGVGLFTTLDFGLKVAGTIAWDYGESLNNIRIGGSFQWTNKSIDYNRLVFSDELDQKYGLFDRFGNDLPTTFVPPNDGRSFTFFTPSLGVVYQGILNKNSRDNKQTHSLLIGLSLHNSFSLKQRLFGDIESILHNEARIPKHWTVFVRGEIVPYQKRNTYLIIKPLFVYQQQSELEYFEVGASVALNRFLEAGIYYHFNKASVLPSVNSNWFSFNVEFGKILLGNNRADIGIAVTRNFSGLQNIFDSIYEFSFSYHLNRSFLCGTGGKRALPCPLWEVSEENKKIYENIWYN